MTKTAKQNPYGIELILDLHGCKLDHIAKDLEGFAKDELERFFISVCQITKMKRYSKPIWWIDKSGRPHLHGISAIQFVETSDIVCHVLPILGAVYLNIFTCKLFEPNPVAQFCKKYWKARSIVTKRIVIRK